TAAERVARRPSSNDAPIADRVLEAILEARRGMVFATLIIVLPLLPVLFLGTLGKALGRPLAVSYVLALLVSMAVALTVTPALSVILFSSGTDRRRESRVMRWLQPRYSAVLSRLIRTPRPAIVALVLLAGVGVAVVPQLRQSPLPTFKETDFLIDLEAAPGTSLTEMNRITTQTSNAIRAIHGVRDIGANVGRAITGDDVANANQSQVWVSLDPKADYDTTVAAVRRAVKGYPGVESDVKTYSQARFSEVETGADEPVVVRVYGAQLDVLRGQAQKVTQALRGTKGIANLRAELPTEEPTVQVEVNLDAAKAAGVAPGDVRRAAAMLVSGIQAGSLFEDQKVFDVVVWGKPATRDSVDAVRALLIDAPNGRQVRLGDVAKVDVASSPNVIERDAVSRRVDVLAEVRGRSRAAVLADVRQRLQKVSFPLEYHYELVGNYAERQALEHRLALIGIAVAVGVFLLLQAAFGSWRMAILAFVPLPLSLVGGAVAVLVHGGRIELGSLAGFLLVFGIAVRNGIALLMRYQHLERHGGDTVARELVVRGGRERLTPVLLTAAAAAVFFLPFALLGDRPGHEIVTPMAWTVLGGLVTSTIVTVFLLPALYLRFAYGKAGSEELDLRDLWESRFGQPPVPADVSGNGHGDGDGDGDGQLVGSEPSGGTAGSEWSEWRPQ
ncbi:MAG: acriflavin resistance protein, partial [Acidimicrobiales bacterium]|nr:acriflavin resistance protein [Acidimicrobiales bacterium]